MAVDVFQTTFSAGEVAKAIGVPLRRVHGWRERGILRPEKELQQGRAMEYGFGHVMVAGVLATLQTMFGLDFRPGNVVGLKTEAIKGVTGFVLDPQALARFGRMLPVQPTRLDGDRTDTAHLVIRVLKGKPHAAIEYNLALQNAGMATFILDLGLLGRKIAKALEAELGKR